MKQGEHEWTLVMSIVARSF